MKCQIINDFVSNFVYILSAALKKENQSPQALHQTDTETSKNHYAFCGA